MYIGYVLERIMIPFLIVVHAECEQQSQLESDTSVNHGLAMQSEDRHINGDRREIEVMDPTTSSQESDSLVAQQLPDYYNMNMDGLTTW